MSLEDKRACQSKLMSLLNDLSKMKQSIIFNIKIY